VEFKHRLAVAVVAVHASTHVAATFQLLRAFQSTASPGEARLLVLVHRLGGKYTGEKTRS
jgi:hypothetical protein